MNLWLGQFRIIMSACFPFSRLPILFAKSIACAALIVAPMIASAGVIFIFKQASCIMNCMFSV